MISFIFKVNLKSVHIVESFQMLDPTGILVYLILEKNS